MGILFPVMEILFGILLFVPVFTDRFLVPGGFFDGSGAWHDEVQKETVRRSVMDRLGSAGCGWLGVLFLGLSAAALAVAVLYLVRRTPVLKKTRRLLFFLCAAFAAALFLIACGIRVSY